MAYLLCEGASDNMASPTGIDTRGNLDFRRLFAACIRPIRLPPRSPTLNAYAERFVRSIKEECLNRVVALGEGHLRLLVREYAAHYHHERNHQGLGNQLLKPMQFASADADVHRRERLGGLLSFYYRDAA